MFKKIGVGCIRFSIVFGLKKIQYFRILLAGGGSSYLHGRGYMAKSSSSNEDVIFPLKEQKDTNKKLTNVVEQLQEKNTELLFLIREERAERERQRE